MDNQSIINQVLIKLFRRINSLEERAICKGKFKKITLNEMHVIAAIGDTCQSMSAVAKALDVTTGTLTISVNSLVRKGLVERVRSEGDRRVVLISLTKLGEEANLVHKNFHERLMDGITENLEEDELEVLARALNKLNQFFISQEKNYMEE